HQIGLAVLVEGVQVRLVLEEIGVELLVGQLQIGLNVVGEHLDVQLHAFLGQDRLDDLEDLGVRHLGGANDQFFRLGGAAGQQEGRRQQGRPDKVDTHM